MSAEAFPAAAGAPRPAESAPGRPESQLVIRYRRVFMGIVLPLLALVVVLAVSQYRSKRLDLMRQFMHLGDNQILEIEHLTVPAINLVRLIRQRFETYLQMPPVYLKDRPERLTPRVLDGRPDGYSLDDLPEALRSELGQLAWLPGLDGPAAGEDEAVVSMALDFYSTARWVHARRSHLQWTYYFSAARSLLYWYPWTPSTTVLEDQGFDSLQASFAMLPRYRFYRQGTPEENPDGDVYWLAPNVDPTTGEAVVTVAVPVYVDGTFDGVVASDLRLAAFHERLAGAAPRLGRVLVVTPDGTLIGDSGQSRLDALVNVGDVLQAGLGPAEIEAAAGSPGHPFATAAHTLFAIPVPNTPWTMALVVSDRDVANHLLPHFIPYLVIVAAVTGAFLLVLVILRRQFIQPAFKLVDYIEQGAREDEPAMPRVPRPWQPGLDRLAAAFQSNRDANRRLRESESFKSAILDKAMLGVVTVDPGGHIVDFNSAAEGMFARARIDVIGSSFCGTLVAPRSRAHFEHLWRRSQQVGSDDSYPDRVEIAALRSDGTELSVLLSMSAIGSADQRFLTVFITDLTKQKRSEEQLARQREALRQSEKMSAMGALLAGVAHELNNPLAILMGRSALLEAKAQDAGTKEVARKIYAAAERCGRIVRTFLSMARQRPPERRPAQLNDVVAGALDLLGYSLRSSGISTITRFDPELPAVNMDADQVGQIVVNLIVNAQQALAEGRSGTAQRGEIRVETRRIGESVELCVSDNGPGVPEELTERIFDPFFTTKPAGSGTGVGLAVSVAIAREHRGELRLEPAGRGATFMLSLPLGEMAPTPASVRHASPDDELFAGHVLIVDDEAEVTEVLAVILESAGFTTTRLAGGREALSWLREHDCDIILTDLRMPDLDGPALWRALREQRPELVGRMAFITGDTLSATAEPFLRSTGRPWLEKPFTPEQVLELVARVEAIRA